MVSDERPGRERGRSLSLTVGKREATVRLLALVTAVATSALLMMSPVAAVAGPAHAKVAPTSAWGKSGPVPGLAALARSDDTVVNSVSCASAGNCSAGGLYEFGTSCCLSRPFVASEVHGTWGQATEVPGLSALGPDGKAAVTSVSCPSAGSCTAVGYYTFGIESGGIADVSAFVVSQVKGTWGQAIEVPGLAALNTGGQAQLASVSCASAGNCTAGGSYGVPHGPGCCTATGFVASQVNGTWGHARPVTGSGGISAVSCPSPGNCAAVGGVVVSQVKGAWRAPKTLIGPRGRKARISSVSCASAGNCIAGGVLPKTGAAVTAGEVKGAWGHVRAVTGLASLLKGGDSTATHSVFTQVSCTAAGQCTAGGYQDKSVEEGSSTRDYATPWVVSQRRGTWGSAQRIPGLGALSKNGYAIVTAVACTAPGRCVVAAAYSTSSYNPDGSGPGQVFAASQIGGAWRAARKLSTPPSVDGPALVTSVACPAVGQCVGGGYLWPSVPRGSRDAFVISQAH